MAGNMAAGCLILSLHHCHCNKYSLFIPTSLQNFFRIRVLGENIWLLQSKFSAHTLSTRRQGEGIFAVFTSPLFCTLESSHQSRFTQYESLPSWEFRYWQPKKKKKKVLIICWHLSYNLDVGKRLPCRD